MAEYMYVFGPGDRPELRTDPSSWTEEDGRVGAAHFERLRAATADGIVILAGLALDDDGPAVVIFEADSDDEAIRFMEEDPFVVHGLFTATLHPFRASLVRGAPTA
jgi:uncharacterized protein YciI